MPIKFIYHLGNKVASIPKMINKLTGVNVTNLLDASRGCTPLSACGKNFSHRHYHSSSLLRSYCPAGRAASVSPGNLLSSTARRDRCAQ